MTLAAVLSGVALGLVCGFVLQQLARHGLWVLSLVVVAVFYPVFGLIEGDTVSAALHSIVLLAYLALAYRAMSSTAGLVATGYLLHGIFDAAVLFGNAATGPEWWPPFCAAYDIVVAIMLLNHARRQT